MSVYFISGIDTAAGKSVAAGMLAKYLISTGKKVITQKLVQTGCEGISEDIQTHRTIMGLPLLPEDTAGTLSNFPPRRIWPPAWKNGLSIRQLSLRQPVVWRKSMTLFYSKARED